MIQDQTNRKDAGKPRYDLLPTELFERFEHDIETCPESQNFDEELQALIDFWNGGDGSLLFLPGTLEDFDGVCRVLEFGAKKYAAHNWETQPLTYSRVYRSALAHAIKHVLKVNDGLDEETGLPHHYHFLCNVMFLWTYDRRGLTALDDRPTGIVRAGSEPQPVLSPVIEVGRRYRLLKPHDRLENQAVGEIVTIKKIDLKERPACRYEVAFGDGLWSNGDFYVGENAVLEPV